MKIEQLNLQAFGPFSERQLDFQGDGLHVVYGANEAGKSSALRALTDLLYGVQRYADGDGDSFLHRKKDLRIGGVLSANDGRKLAFVRKSGNVKSMLGPDGEVLEEQALVPFLNGVSRERFNMLFGIDHSALVEGGEDILKQKGDIGQVLFSAALGSGHVLQDVLVSLDAEAGELFKPTGTKPQINALIKEYNDLNRQVKQTALSANQWEKHSKALQSAMDDLKEVHRALSAHRTESVRLERIRSVLPKLTQHRNVQTELQQMGKVILLPENFTERRRSYLKQLEDSGSVLARLAPQLEQLQADSEQLIINQDLLDQSDIAGELHASLGSYRNSVDEVPTLEAERQQLLSDARAILQMVRPEVGLDDAELLRPILARKRLLIEQAGKEAALNDAVQRTQSSYTDEQKRLLEIRAVLKEAESPDSPDVLKSELASARGLGEIDKAIDDASREIAGEYAQCTEALSRLKYWDGELDAMGGLRLPSAEEIATFEVNFDELVTSRRDVQGRLDTLTDGLREIARDLDEIGRVGQVMTEDMLLQTRDERDSLWHLLRRQWVDGEQIAIDTALYHSGESNLHGAFENRMSAADDAADRLRRETDRVFKVASLSASQKNDQLEVERLEQKWQSLSKKQQLLVEQWQQLWVPAGISPDVPKVMVAWSGRFDSLRERVARMKQQQESLAELQRKRNIHVQSLTKQITALGRVAPETDQISPLLLSAESLVDAIEAAQRKRDERFTTMKMLEQSVKLLENDVSKANTARDLWAQDWASLLETLSLPATTRPVEIDDLIENVRQLMEKKEEAGKRQNSMNAASLRIKAFDDQVTQLVASLAPELAGESADVAVARLIGLVGENRSRLQEQQHLKKRIEEAHDGIRQAEHETESMNKRLQAMCVEADCEEYQQLEDRERRFTTYQQHVASIAQIESDVLAISDGIDIEQMHIQAQAIDVDALPSIVLELNEKIRELEQQNSELTETKAREKVELKQMSAGGSSADLAAQASGVLARIRSEAEQYVRVKLAARILRSQIERFRRENQGPVISRASEHFSALTLHSFDALIADVNKKNEPVLAGVRTDGTDPVPVEGMSSGTLDQLYLALRFALLEKYLSTSGPMPFIVDDVLIEFDDERCLAALQSMATLGEKTQVIVFTHHLRVLEQARQLQGRVHTHQL